MITLHIYALLCGAAEQNVAGDDAGNIVKNNLCAGWHAACMLVPCRHFSVVFSCQLTCTSHGIICAIGRGWNTVQLLQCLALIYCT